MIIIENSSFFNSIDHDRVYKAEDWARYFASFIANGIFPNPSSGLQVITGSGMNITVQVGKAWINGYFYWIDSNLTLTLPNAHGSLNRIDRIVLRWSLTNRNIRAFVKSSTPSANPVAPALQRDADAFEICLADIFVTRGVTGIIQSNITDRRLNKDLCGIVHGVVTQLDTTTLGQQLQGFIDSYIAKTEADYADWLDFLVNLKNLSNQKYQEFLAFLTNLKVLSNEEYQLFLSYIQNLRDSADQTYISFIDWLNQYRISAGQEFEDWFETIKDILDENAVGNLLLLIEVLQDLEPTVTLGTIVHTLAKYPICQLFKTKWAAGIGGAGLGGGGGESLVKVKGGFELSELDEITVMAPKEFKNCTDIHKINENQYAFVDVGSDIETTSLLLVIY